MPEKDKPTGARPTPPPAPPSPRSFSSTLTPTKPPSVTEALARYRGCEFSRQYNTYQLDRLVVSMAEALIQATKVAQDTVTVLEAVSAKFDEQEQRIAALEAQARAKG